MEKTSKDVMFPYYSGNIKLTKAIGHVSLEDFVNAHKYPKQTTLDIMLKVQEATKAGDLALKRQLKHQLYSFTPSVLIQVGCGRKYENVVDWTELLSLDFDCIETVNKAHNLKEYLFITYQCVICTYFSPSMKGVKALIRIPKPRDKEHFKAIHKSVENEFEQYGYFDVATKNAMLPLFLSVDTDIFAKDFSRTLPWEGEDWSVIQRQQTKSTNQLNFIPSERYATEDQYTYDKTLRIFESRVNAIIEAGHPQIRTACLLLGSRAGAGYISKAEAEQLAESMIRQNDYLSKNIQGYIDTAKWAIGEGYKSPKYY